MVVLKLYGKGFGMVLLWGLDFHSTVLLQDLISIKVYDVSVHDLLLTFKEESRTDVGAKKLIHEGNEDAKVKTLMHRWRFPSLSLHGSCRIGLLEASLLAQLYS